MLLLGEKRGDAFPVENVKEKKEFIRLTGEVFLDKKANQLTVYSVYSLTLQPKES